MQSQSHLSTPAAAQAAHHKTVTLGRCAQNALDAHPGRAAPPGTAGPVAGLAAPAPEVSHWGVSGALAIAYQPSRLVNCHAMRTGIWYWLKWRLISSILSWP